MPRDFEKKFKIRNCRGDHYSSRSSRTNESWSRMLLNRCNKTEMRWNKKESLPLVSRTLANFVRQNSQKIRSRLINSAKHLDCYRLKMILSYIYLLLCRCLGDAVKICVLLVLHALCEHAVVLDWRCRRQTTYTSRWLYMSRKYTWRQSSRSRFVHYWMLRDTWCLSRNNIGLQTVLGLVGRLRLLCQTDMWEIGCILMIVT